MSRSPLAKLAAVEEDAAAASDNWNAALAYPSFDGALREVQTACNLLRVQQHNISQPAGADRALCARPSVYTSAILSATRGHGLSAQGRGSQREHEAGSNPRFSRFAGHGFWGELDVGAIPRGDVLVEVARIIDPASANETIHWGRNYLYATCLDGQDGPIEVIVKQFRNQGWRRRWERKLRGSKAQRSWAVAQKLIEVGIRTPAPLILVESEDPEGPSFFVTRRVEVAFEVRHFFRRLNGDSSATDFPPVEPEAFLRHLGSFARRLHDAGIWYRDLSMGNVLAVPVREGGLPELEVVDFNRARTDRRLGVVRRTRDLCRFPVVERSHRRAFLEGYWGSVPNPWSPRWLLHIASVRGYLIKHAIKNRLRGQGATRRVVRSGAHHAHIPPADPAASARDKIVWDRLSDQPHQHAGKLEKLIIRAADAPSHLRDFAVVATSLPAAWKRFRELKRTLYEQPTPFSGAGVCTRPWPEHKDQQLASIDELGVRRLLLRLHPWDEDHDDEEWLARELAGRGYELCFALPQNRDLVRDRGWWRSAIAELADRFAPYGRQFQVGQAVNRSKWGVWTRGEYVDLFLEAAEILRRRPGVEILGPAVIDFEYQVTLALLNRRVAGLSFDIVSALLYVDRRGAPESAQLGFNTVDKAVLLRAISDTARNSKSRCWITEVNWPLWEGPHSPAGRSVSVDEESQASFLVRYFLLVLGTGLIERVYWWRLLARGYGLISPDREGLRRRPSYAALQTIVRELEGSTFLGPLRTEPGVWLYHFRRNQDDVVVGWCSSKGRRARLPGCPLRVVTRDGAEITPPPGVDVDLGPAPQYFFLSRTQ
jgi:hypothetical protein